MSLYVYYTANRIVPTIAQTSNPPMQSKTPSACPVNNFDTLSCANTKRLATIEAQNAPYNLPNSVWYLVEHTCSFSLETNVSRILTAGFVHPSGPSFAESGAVVMVSTGHTFSFSTFYPFFVDITVDALEVQTQ